MGRDGEPSPKQDVLTVVEAAALWGVSRSVAYQWVATGVVTCFRPDSQGEMTARRRDVATAKVFRLARLEQRGIDTTALTRAVTEGTVKPKAGRFSVADLKAACLSPNGSEASDAPDGPKRRQSGFICKALVDLQDQERAWVARGADVRDLPDEHFHTLKPPEVIPPVGVFRFRPGASVGTQPGMRYVERSAGYSEVNGKLVWLVAEDHFAVIGDLEPLRAEWVESNHLHRLAQSRSDVEWWSRKQAGKTR